MPYVTIDEPRRMNLLGLMLADLMERNLAGEDGRKRASRLSGDMVVQAGRMGVTLRFGDNGGVTVKRGAEKGARASMSGSLDTLMDLALGGGVVWPVLARRLKVGGNLILLLKLKRLLTVA